MRELMQADDHKAANYYLDVKLLSLILILMKNYRRIIGMLMLLIKIINKIWNSKRDTTNKLDKCITNKESIRSKF